MAGSFQSNTSQLIRFTPNWCPYLITSFKSPVPSPVPLLDSFTIKSSKCNTRPFQVEYLWKHMEIPSILASISQTKHSNLTEEPKPSFSKSLIMISTASGSF